MQKMYKMIQKQQTNKDAIKILQQIATQNQKLLYLNINNDIVTGVCSNTKNQITIRQSSINSIKSITTNFINILQIDRQISLAFIQGNDGFIIYNKPFQIYFITKQQQHPIKLILHQQLSFQPCILNLSYPNIVIYGKKLGNKIKQINDFNLQTLAFKLINDGKNNAPSSRIQQFNMLIDGRIYVFGGINQKGNNCDSLIWVYDMERTVWFSLDMIYPLNQDFSLCQKIPISSSKVLVISKKSQKIWIFQIHQSKITQIQGQIKLEGKYAFLKGQLIQYSENGWKFTKKEIIHEKK